MSSIAWDYAEIGRARVWWRSRGPAAENVVVGHMERELAEYLERRFDAVIREHGHTVAFHDWSEAPTYDAAYRVSWQHWLSRQTHIKSVHFITTSRILSMGVKVANLAYPRVEFVLHTTRASYEHARVAHLPPAPPRT